jgi:hypothetical protein
VLSVRPANEKGTLISVAIPATPMEPKEYDFDAH